jgi:hypothetical protein
LNDRRFASDDLTDELVLLPPVLETLLPLTARLRDAHESVLGSDAGALCFLRNFPRRFCSGELGADSEPWRDADVSSVMSSERREDADDIEPVPDGTGLGEMGRPRRLSSASRHG